MGSTSAVPLWDPSVSHTTPARFVAVTASVRGHAPEALHATPALASIVLQCDVHCDKVPTEDQGTGLRVYLRYEM